MLRQCSTDAIGDIHVFASDFPFLQCTYCFYQIGNYNDALFVHYGVTMPLRLAEAVAKRRCEYLAGRVLFKYLYRRLPDTQLNSGAQGEPLWPEGYIGSISHADGVAICCLAQTSELEGVGIDIESILTEEVASELDTLILQPQEQQILKSLTSLRYSEYLTIAFSAKESLYKALYPQVQRFFGFEDAAIIRLDTSKQQFTLQLTTTLTPLLRAGTQFTGYYYYLAQKVVSLITLQTKQN